MHTGLWDLHLYQKAYHFLNMPCIDSPLRYPGGKTAYSSLLREIIVLNRLKGHKLAECFAGGAGASVSLLLNGTVPHIILNDYDKAIYSVWHTILRHPKKLIKWIENTPITIETWKEQKHIYCTEKKAGFELGVATFFLNRCNRSGIILANPIGGIKQEGKYRIDARFNKNKLIEKIKKISSFKKNISIYNLDALNFIELMNFSEDKVFMYFDPPYYQKGETLYLNHYDHNGHMLLAQSIQNTRCPWVLSYDACDSISQIYRNYPIYEKRLLYSIMPPTKGLEYIITPLIVPNEVKKARVLYSNV